MSAPSAPTPERMFWGSCPECGASLDVRSGEHGRFLGCSSFPQCEFTRSLDRAEENILAGEGYLDRTENADADDQGGDRHG